MCATVARRVEHCSTRQSFPGSLAAALAASVLALATPASAGVGVRMTGDRVQASFRQESLCQVLEDLALAGSARLKVRDCRDDQRVEATFDALPLHEVLARLLPHGNYLILYGPGGKLKSIDVYRTTTEGDVTSGHPTLSRSAVNNRPFMRTTSSPVGDVPIPKGAFPRAASNPAIRSLPGPAMSQRPEPAQSGGGHDPSNADVPDAEEPRGEGRDVEIVTPNGDAIDLLGLSDEDIRELGSDEELQATITPVPEGAVPDIADPPQGDA